MRLLVSLLFLLTPLQPLAALALCVSVEHGDAMPCDPGMAGASERNGESHGVAAGVPTGTAHFVMISSGDVADLAGACGALGLCSARVPGVASTVLPAFPERPADKGSSSFLPELGPGIRPAPPPHPPRA